VNKGADNVGAEQPERGMSALLALNSSEC